MGPEDYEADEAISRPEENIEYRDGNHLDARQSEMEPISRPEETVIRKSEFPGESKQL